MPKITEEPLVRMQVRLFKKDSSKLKQLFASNIGVNKAIRAIVRSFLTQAEAKANKEIDDIESVQIPLKIEE